MNFNTLSDAHLKNFQAMVAPDRFSSGDSILDLHARDQSAHPACRPEAVIWPQEASSTSNETTFPEATRSAGGMAASQAR